MKQSQPIQSYRIITNIYKAVSFINHFTEISLRIFVKVKLCFWNKRENVHDRNMQY